MLIQQNTVRSILPVVFLLVILWLMVFQIVFGLLICSVLSVEFAEGLLLFGGCSCQSRVSSSVRNFNGPSMKLSLASVSVMLISNSDVMNSFAVNVRNYHFFKISNNLLQYEAIGSPICCNMLNNWS